jgi:hypothetical protein
MLPKQHEEGCRDTANQTNVRTMNIVSRRIPQRKPGLHDCYCPLGSRSPHFISHHQSEIPTAVVTVDIPSAAANTFAPTPNITRTQFPTGPNAALDHQRVDVVTPLLEMHGPIRFTSSHPPELCLFACDKEPANLRRRYCSGSNVVMLRPSALTPRGGVRP